jgi:hypothetical protein
MFINEAIAENAHALVLPETDKLGLGAHLVEGGHKETFVHAGQITQVENVMELHGGTRQLLAALVVETESGVSDRIDARGALFRELEQRFPQDAGVNLLGGFLAGEGDVEHVVEGHQAGVNSVVTTAGRRDTRNVLSVNDISKFPLATTLVKLVL